MPQTTTTAPPDNLDAQPEVLFGDPLRIFGVMTRDPATDTVLLFGGQMSFTGPLADSTWAFDDASGWYPIELSAQIPGRVGLAMTGVDSLDGVLIFGGGSRSYRSCRTGFCSQPLDDMWLVSVDTLTATPLEPALRPSARYGHTMVYDSESNLVVLFGGKGVKASGDADLLDDTWVFDPSTAEWRQVESPQSPSAREQHQMVYDPVTDLIYLWGGRSASLLDPDPSIWIFDTETETWIAEEAAASGPAPRWFHQLVLDAELRRLVLLGGRWVHTETTDDGTSTEVQCGDELWTYNLDSHQWLELEPRDGLYLCWQASAALGDGEVLNITTSFSTILNVDLGTWVETPFD